MPQQTMCGVTMPTEATEAIGVIAVATGYEWECPTCGTWNTCDAGGPPAVGTRYRCSKCSSDVVIDELLHPEKEDRC